MSLSEGVVRVLAVDGLAVHRSDSMWPPFGKDRRVTLELHAHHLVHAAGGVVPVHLVGGDVVSADFGGLVGMRRRRHCLLAVSAENEYREEKNDDYPANGQGRS